MSEEVTHNLFSFLSVGESAAIISDWVSVDIN
ncbi:hypothetical protein YPC_1555 [Yersinia pestis biovar Medievalis str. Harbin 35]|nr:hypothetical protein YPC_1555 [Yersinia pestis biovar Medievalis str. Harbin 35]EEO76207.1 hypothetical protein YP516_2404 [Yersinia pestis Nepal516]EEO80281.1 hypothetical protein YPF_3097 [Yersinia pestis biovar Orientalis str. India 195]EEO89812.1 hypothetical protein YPS_3086 [Yersinia pestis Pestoides A]